MIIAKPLHGKKFNGLITYILRQLKRSSNPIFLRFIQDLHVQYQEGKLRKYNAMRLILDVEDKIRVLKHAEAWETSLSSQDVPAMALNTTTVIPDQLRDFLVNHITAEIRRLAAAGRSTPTDHGSANKDGKSKSRFSHQERMFVPPANLSDTKTVQGRSYNWCTKCNKGGGQWVQAHTTDTHQDGYRFGNRQRGDLGKRTNSHLKANVAQQSETPPTKRPQRGILHHGKQVTFDPPSSHDDYQPSAQISLADSLPYGFRFDVQDLIEDDP